MIVSPQEKRPMNVDGIQLRFDGGLWVGAVSSKFGTVEVLFSGSDAGPDEQQVQAYRRFAEHLDANIARLRKQIFFGFMWQPIRIAINMENRVGVQFRNRLTGNQGKLILDELSREKLRPVAGAAVMSHEGKVIYNLLTPHMQQFLGRCVGAIKKAGIKAKGSGQFSVVLGDLQTELRLDEFYKPTDDPAIVDAVVARAKELAAA
jgi:hypothetical protein